VPLGNRRGRSQCLRIAGASLLFCGAMALAFFVHSRHRSFWLNDFEADGQATEALVLEGGSFDAEANQVQDNSSMVYVSNAFSGECLDWADQIVVAATCIRSKAQQKWKYMDHTLRIPLSRCMDSGGASLHIWPCAASGPMRSNQHWSYSSSTGLLQNGGTHACLHLQEHGNGSSLLSLRPCSVAERRQKWVLKTNPLHMPQRATSRSSSSSNRSSRKSAALGADILPTTGMLYGTTMAATNLEAAKETTQENRRTTRRETASMSRDTAPEKPGVLKLSTTSTAAMTKALSAFAATSTTVKSYGRIEPTTTVVPEMPLSTTVEPPAQSIELPTAETPQEMATGAKIKQEKQPPTTSMVTGLEPNAVKCDQDKKHHKQLHMKKRVPTKDAETNSHVPMRAAMRFQHHGGCLRADHNLVYLDLCNRSDLQSTWIMTSTGMLMSVNEECMDAGGELLLVRNCDVVNEQQQWTISGDLGARIKSRNGQCLGSHWTIAAPRAKVYLSTCNDDFAQEWTVEQTQVPVKESRPVNLRFVVIFVGVLMLVMIVFFLFAVPLVSLDKQKKKQKPQPESELNYDFLRDPTIIPNDPSSYLSPEVSQVILGPLQHQPGAFRALGICGFAYRRARGHHEGLDALNGCGYLGNSHSMSPPDPPLELIIKGQLRTFDNAEAAFQALKFSGMAGTFEGLSGEEALQKANELAGVEDRKYDGRGSMWKAMFEVLAVKFRVGTAAAAALEMTGDDFLLCYSCEEGLDFKWSNNHIGNGTNWLGMQLMLMRSSRTGWRRWAQFIESNFDITTGQPLDIEGRPWVAWHQTVFRATTAIQVDLQDQGETLQLHDGVVIPSGELESHAQPEIVEEVPPTPHDDVAAQRA